MTEAAVLAAPFAGVPERELREAIDAFGRDVLNAWAGGGEERVKVWTSPPDRKDYHDAENGKRRVHPRDVLAHLRGEATVAVGPIRQTLVIDHDLPCVPNGEEAADEAKARSRAAVSALLTSFGLPHVHFDGRRGSHTWIRLPGRDATDAERSALRLLLNGPGRHAELAETGARFDVFPHGGSCVRLPLGVYLGRPRGAVPALTEPELLRWLRDPKRATEEQLTALVAAAPKQESGPPVQPAAGKVAERLPEPYRTTPAGVEPPAPPAPIEGWGRWPACKRAVAVAGPLPGKRHNTLLSLACEAVESGERDEKRLAAFLEAVPRPHSTTGAAENRADAGAAARGALALHAAHDARRLSSCPNIPTHSGHPQTNQHRETFKHECAPESAARCPIRQRWEAARNLPAFAPILKSSIWRSGRGHGAGLGYEAKEVYKVCLRLSGGDPNRTIQAAKRYIAIRLPNIVRETAAKNARARLAACGLLEEVDGDRALYRVPFRPPAWLDELERRLGTTRLADNERREILRHWHEQDHLTSP